GEGSGVSVNVGVGDTSGVEVNVGVGDSAGVAVSTGVVVSTGVEEPTGVADPSGGELDNWGEEPTGVAVSLDTEVGVGDSTAVEIAVGAVPVMVTSAPVEGRAVRSLFPVETRTVHSTEVCPACNPVTSKVKTGPLVVALFPLLPAIATIKVPF